MKKKETKKKILEYVFSILAPGTPLRLAIDRIQEASLGAIVVLGDSADLAGIMRGGFKLNTSYTPQKLYELSKMDGGIILSEDIKTIYGANIQLQPNSNIKTDESGTRHQSAERVAKQTGNLVITVSERRNKITIYKGDFRYTLHDIGDLLVKSSQAIMALEKYAVAISRNLINLTVSEFDNMVTLYDIVEVIRMYGLLFRMSDELVEYISELGTEGRLVKIQYQEIMLNQNEEFNDLIKDYKKNDEKVEKVVENIRMLNKEELLEDENIANILGFNLKNISFDEIITSRGYRILGTINKVTKKDIELLVGEFEEIQAILIATVEEMTQIKGISKLKAEHINKALTRIKNKVMLDRY
ncbi:DNA integrity scanning protein DisA [Leptotrichia sp. OH3620_COT-345]|uniref:DNA integrity scanning diadenylate cyclase DisA n=1 Tax=Leptotrichia sp. OH3620_COT-345 TaxID=2491048 RepID=UPI000F6521DC|nr:DNA integrity scanning diadenylate cyclase DisA [Leptotrichia sp. OH3620_COT-345]RRD40968.1 DNA integrity scanning protein DisA [Leptotrichia sp. OH3620_COT-345]